LVAALFGAVPLLPRPPPHSGASAGVRRFHQGIGCPNLTSALTGASPSFRLHSVCIKWAHTCVAMISTSAREHLPLAANAELDDMISMDVLPPMPRHDEPPPLESLRNRTTAGLGENWMSGLESISTA
jgi:hypothetical protein